MLRPGPVCLTLLLFLTLGAERAGLTGILIDHWGAYPDPPCRRITRLSELSRTLADLNR